MRRDAPARSRYLAGSTIGRGVSAVVERGRLVAREIEPEVADKVETARPIMVSERVVVKVWTVSTIRCAAV
jgi:hypothetical protein